MLNNIAVYPLERDLFYRDYADRVYGVSAFFLTYTFLEIPFEIISSLIFAVLADLAVGLERTAKIFFIVTFNAFCVVSCGESLGITFNTLFTHTGFSVNCMSVFLSIAQIMGTYPFPPHPFLPLIAFLGGAAEKGHADEGAQAASCPSTSPPSSTP